jgi:uncharacterized damage-inducible protein DinB
MAWANQAVFAQVQELPLSALDAYVANPEFAVGTILKHIVDGADWYVYCLTEQHWTDRNDPKTWEDVQALARELAAFDARILSESADEDRPMTIKEDDRSFSALRSTLVAQAVHHATEHRAQLVAALEKVGMNHINLDDLDFWAFERVDAENLSN